jgi:ABC-2 type transport system ATP-binding protein
MIFSMLYGKKPSKEKIEELLFTFDLKKFENQKAGKLSSGERVRLNLAKAFVNDPKLLLLDEPTASLDPAVSFKVREIIKERQTSLGTAILWTSHNMREIENVCDRVIFINKGKIVAKGTPEELRNLFKKQDLEEIFISLVKS